MTTNRMRGVTILVTLLIAGATLTSAWGQRPRQRRPAGDAPAQGKDQGEAGEKVVKTDAQWRAQLTRQQYYVTRLKGTEPAWSGKYAHGKFKGTFVCVGCGAELFSASHKFESGTGWPSFWRPIEEGALTTAPDYTMFEPRIEVNCARCDAHLGHVFNDGPRPTGLRFCINSVALKLQPPGADKAKSKADEGKKTEDEAPATRRRRPASPAPDRPRRT